MTKVRMLIKVAGSRDGQDWPEIGETIDVPKTEAEQLFLNRQAAPAGDKDAEIEAAVINHDPEVAVIGTVPVADHHTTPAAAIKAAAKSGSKAPRATDAKEQAEAIHDAPKPAAQVGGKPGLSTDTVAGA
jgi:hypothetical protein